MMLTSWDFSEYHLWIHECSSIALEESVLVMQVLVATGDFPALVFLFGEGLLHLECFDDDITMGVVVECVPIIGGLGVLSETIELYDDTLMVEGEVMTGWWC